MFAYRAVDTYEFEIDEALAARVLAADPGAAMLATMVFALLRVVVALYADVLAVAALVVAVLMTPWVAAILVFAVPAFAVPVAA